MGLSSFGKKYKISIIGLGYVGIPLTFSEYNKVLVYDVNETGYQI
tara:strand:+ start:216 stop:350 length:135 start_codon:yes stop_codon:yes gene_type:complete